MNPKNDKPLSDAEFFVLESIARPVATRMAQDVMNLVVQTAKSKPIAEGQLASLIAELCLQTVVTSLVIQIEDPGSAAGEEIITKHYDMYKDQAAKRWHKQDLKDARAKGLI